MQWQKINKYSQYLYTHMTYIRATIWLVHILCDAIELKSHVCAFVIYRSLTQATIIHAYVSGGGEVVFYISKNTCYSGGLDGG